MIAAESRIVLTSDQLVVARLMRNRVPDAIVKDSLWSGDPRRAQIFLVKRVFDSLGKYRSLSCGVWRSLKERTAPNRIVRVEILRNPDRFLLAH
jgi:hypothetical protein